MASLKITAPDGKTLRVVVPDGTPSSQYGALAEEAVQSYMESKTPIQTTGNPILDQNLQVAHQGGSGLLQASTDLGTDVKAGISGLAEPIANVLGTTAEDIENPNYFTDLANKSLSQGAANVEAVEQGQTPETAAGRAGEFVGSFFTPNQIALQGGVGAVAKPLVSAAGRVANPVIKGLVNAFPKISEFFGASPEAISTLVDNPAAVNAAKGMPEVAEGVASTVRGLSQKGMNIAQQGAALLSDVKNVPGIKDKLLNYAVELESNPLAEASDKLASEYVLDVASKIKDSLSEKEIGKLIGMLDEKIGAKWAKANPSVITAAKEDVRRIMSRALQSQNPEYAKAMAESASTFGPTEALSKSLGLKEGLPGDTTIGALKKVISPEALATQRALASFPGLAEAVANASAKESLKQSLLGNLALHGVPLARPVATGTIQSLPAVGNAVYQGLTQ